MGYEMEKARKAFCGLVLIYPALYALSIGLASQEFTIFWIYEYSPCER